MSSIQVGQITNTRGGLGGQLSRRVQFNNAQIKALPTTTPVLVPGIDGKIILPCLVAYILNPWIADYTNIDVTAKIAVNVSGNPYSNPTFAPGALLAQGHAEVIWTDVGREFDYTGVAYANVVSQSLLLTVTNGAAGAFTGGGAGSILTVQVFYELIQGE